MKKLILGVALFTALVQGCHEADNAPEQSAGAEEVPVNIINLSGALVATGLPRDLPVTGQTIYDGVSLPRDVTGYTPAAGGEPGRLYRRPDAASPDWHIGTEEPRFGIVDREFITHPNLLEGWECRSAYCSIHRENVTMEEICEYCWPGFRIYDAMIKLYPGQIRIYCDLQEMFVFTPTTEEAKKWYASTRPKEILEQLSRISLGVPFLLVKPEPRFSPEPYLCIRVLDQHGNNKDLNQLPETPSALARFILEMLARLPGNNVVSWSPR